MRRQAGDTTDRVLMAAHNLFYRQGIRATGADRVALLAKVAPAQLYRLFDSKDDLVAAYTERADARARDRLDAAAKAVGGWRRAARADPGDVR
jgi:AcrR family transcriptional regulator